MHGASGAGSIPACNKLVSLFENGGVSADDLSIEGLNGLIATYKYILANSDSIEGQQKYRQILYFAELCKEEYSAKIVQDSVESGNNQQVQDLLADEVTRADIIEGMISYANGSDVRLAGLNGDADSYFNSLSPLLDIMENPDYAKDLDEALSSRDYMFGDLHQAAFKDLLSATSMYRDGELTEAERSELESLAGYYNDQYNALVNDKSVGFDNFGEGSLRDFYRNVSASLNKAAQAGDVIEATQYLHEGFEDINTENIQARLAATGVAGVSVGIGRGVVVRPTDIFNNPSLLKSNGQATNFIESIKTLNNRQWSVGTLNKGSQAGNGLTIREIGSNGNPTGRYIQYHPGGGHHGASPYWKVSSPKGGTVRIPVNPQKFK